MPIGPKRLPFLEHIDELRRRIVIIVIVLLIATGVLYEFADTLLAWLMGPIIPYLPDGKFFLPGPWDPWTFKLRVAMYGAIVVTSPVWLWQVLAFFLPALKPKEMRYFIPTFIVGSILFVLGNLFCYKIILAKTFEFTMGQVSGALEVLPVAKDYLTGVTWMMVGFGLSFELPVVVFYLVMFGVIPYAKLRSSWRTVYVVLMVLAAIITPDISPVTMALLFAALVGLYEISLVLARIVLNKRIKALAAAEAAGLDAGDE